MGSSWKAMTDENRRQMAKKTPTEIAKSFEFTLPAASTHVRVSTQAMVGIMAGSK
jgi:hypothetical protein